MSLSVLISPTRSWRNLMPRVEVVTAAMVRELTDAVRRNLTARGVTLETANHLIAGAFFLQENWGVWIHDGGVRIKWDGGYVFGHARETPPFE